jgi:hypothetical protein
MRQRTDGIARLLMVAAGDCDLATTRQLPHTPQPASLSHTVRLSPFSHTSDLTDKPFKHFESRRIWEKIPAILVDIINHLS